MKKSVLLLVISSITILLSACNLITKVQPNPTDAPLPTLVAIPTEIPLPTLQPVIQPTAVPTPAPTPTVSPVSLIKADIIFDNYLLRTGPGRLFEQIAMYDTGSTVEIIGSAKGGEWVLVQTKDHRSGWMNIVGLQYNGDIITLPIFNINFAQVLHGHVYKPDKSPATAIAVSLAPAFSSDPNLQDESNTNLNGEWYFYLPLDKTGKWYVGPNAYSCKSNAVDASCALLWKIPDYQEIILPFTQDVAIEFMMK